jgi:hypothetical protein
MGIRRIRRAAREGRYEFTLHALDEMDEDGLADADVRQVLLHGKLVDKLTQDPRGNRFVLLGSPQGKDVNIEVVCRILPSGLLRIITVYVLRG